MAKNKENAEVKIRVFRSTHRRLLIRAAKAKPKMTLAEVIDYLERNV